MGVYKNGSIIGSVGGGKSESLVIEEALRCIKKGESKSFKIESIEANRDNTLKCESKLEVFINVFNEKPKLILVGGGHVSHELYKLGIYSGFSVTIFEDRQEFCTKERFPDASELIYGELAKNLRNYNIDDNCYVVMVSRGHIEDQLALKEVVNSSAKYIGMIGSKSKVKNIFDNLINEGISGESLAKVYAPIGISIGGSSISEIVIGIISEIILVKNNKSLNHMRDINKGAVAK